MTSYTQDTIARDRNIKCSSCLGRLRKIEELEGMVSCKNDILSAQQNRLHTFETNYKQLFDNFEGLRLDYSYALQANCSLNEIYLKLGQVKTERKRCTIDAKQKELSSIVESERVIESLLNKEQPHFQKFRKIQTIFKTQNCTLKINRNNNFAVKETQEGQGKLKEPKYKKSGDGLESNSNFKKVSVGIETQQTYIKEVKSEENLRKITLPKQTISELPSQSASVITEETMASNSKTTIKKDKQTVTINIDDPDLPMMVVDLKVNMQQQSKQFEKCACQLVEQLDDMHDSNQVLADTLGVVTQENKNNLQIITDLKSELKRANEECETKMYEMKKVIDQLVNELEDKKIVGKNLRNSIDITENQVQKLQGSLEEVMEQNRILKKCKCDYEQQLRTNLTQGGDEINKLRKELEERKLELTEYEEENKHYSQTIEILNKQNTDLHTKVRQLEKEQLMKNVQNQCEKCTGTSLIQIDIDDLKNKIKQLELDKKYLTDKGKKHELEMDKTLSEVDRLKSAVITQLNQVDGLSIENDELKKEIQQLKRDNQLETEKLQEAVGKSQIQVEELLKEHDTKSNEIEQVANELTNIRRSVSEDNEKYLGIIRRLEKEREDLEIKLKQRSDCICGEGKAELERIKTELIKKQVIIFELERSVKELTENYKTFHKTAEDLAYENSMLKSDRDNYVRDLEALQAALSEKINELEEIRKKLENSDILCNKCNQANKDTSVQKAFKCNCHYCDKIELEIELMKMDLEKLNKEKRQLEMRVADYYQLQMELDSLRGEAQKRDALTCKKMCDLQKAYDELKYLFDIREKENEKLRNELIKSEAQKGDSEKKCECLTTENKKLKAQTGVAFEEASAMKEECEQLNKTCAKKSMDIKILKDDVKVEMEQKRICYENCEELKKKQATSDIELMEMRGKLEELRKKYDDKSQELTKIKKQYDSCVKQSKLSREEYTTLRHEYKEIKATLSDQLGKYKKEAEKVNGKTKKPCNVVKELRNQLMDKERQIEDIQQKLKDSSYEIIELKDYIHKLISDDNALKTGINSLVENLERKMTGAPSLGSFPSNSAEAIAGEILHSLSNIEDIISKSPPTCPKGCGFKNCDCMSQITSQYSFKTKPQEESRKGFTESRSFCGSPSSETKTEILHKVAWELCGRCPSEPSRVTSEPNTTDSDDPNADRQSLEFYKDAVVDMRTRLNKTVKEKSCCCEPRETNDLTTRRDKTRNEKSCEYEPKETTTKCPKLFD